MKHINFLLLICIFTGFSIFATPAIASEAHTFNSDSVVDRQKSCSWLRWNDSPAGPLFDHRCGCDQQAQCWSGTTCDEGFRVKESILGIPLCEWSGNSKEPNNSDVKVPSQEGLETLRGWSDIHEHQFGNLAYGGSTFWGAPYHEDGINSALAWCDYTHEHKFLHPVSTMEQHSWLYPDHGSPIHGYADGFLYNPFTVDIDQMIWGFTNNMAVFGNPFFFHLPAGTGPFDGWPHFFQGGHQQMYYKWLERAYQGGLRLLVNHAVNNKVLCEASYHREDLAKESGLDHGQNPCRDMNGKYDTGMSTVDQQIQGFKDLEEYIDRKNDNQVNDNGWYKIVESAGEARDAIRNGRLAVIIGIEVDHLFNCTESAARDGGYCTKEYVSEQVAKYKTAGVRYFFPVHFYKNAFSGGAWYNGLFVATDVVDDEGLADVLPNVLDMENYGWNCYDLGYRHVNLEAADVFNVIPPAPDEYSYADCNFNSLTELGEHLLEELIENDMFIDIDHFPLLSLWGHSIHGGQISFPSPGTADKKGALDIFEDLDGTRGYPYPVHSSHPMILDQPISEYQHFPSTIRRIRNLGGIAAANMARGRCKTTNDFAFGYEDSTFKDRHVKGFVEIVDLMSGHTDSEETPFYGAGFPAISMTADMGSFLDQTGPRFWRDENGHIGEDKIYEDPILNLFGQWDDCEGKDKVAPKLSYPFFPFDNTVAKGEFDKQKTGDRTFDFNADGLAHIGLMPDMLADVDNIFEARKKQGKAPGTDLEPLFNSAETFVRMWERIENCTPDKTPPTPVVDPLPTVTGICSVTVATRPMAIDSCAIPYGSQIVATTNDSQVYTKPGEFTINWTYKDEQDNSSSQPQTVSVTDDDPPTVDHLSATPEVLSPPNNKMVLVTITAEASDNCDPNPYCRVTAVSSNGVDGHSASKSKTPDWIINGGLALELRAERDGFGDDRVYEIEVTCSDTAGNPAIGHVEVRVPHDNRK